MSKVRKEVSHGRRFKVLCRDNFTCRFCGAGAPDVRVVVDHIQPLSKGGSNSFDNLITACYECNSGKGDTELKKDYNPHTWVAKKILSKLITREKIEFGMSRSEIGDYFKGEIPSDDLAKALELLRLVGFAECVIDSSSSKRPKHIWRALLLGLLFEEELEEAVSELNG